MNAPVRIVDADAVPNIEDFCECCADQAWFLDLGIIEIVVAADNLQWLADRWGLIDLHGQDAIQAEMAAAFMVPHNEIPLAPEPEPTRRTYSTPRSTVDAFWYVASLDDAQYLKRWLAQHPRDVAALQKLWGGKHARI